MSGFEDLPTVGHGGTKSSNEADYYVIKGADPLIASMTVTFAICTRCGVPVYDRAVHDEFHAELAEERRRMEAMRDAMSHLS